MVDFVQKIGHGFFSFVPFRPRPISCCAILPSVKKDTLIPPRRPLIRSSQVAFTSEKISLLDLRDRVHWLIRPTNRSLACCGKPAAREPKKWMFKMRSWRRCSEPTSPKAETFLGLDMENGSGR
jgi:hypothetical protein